MDYITNFSEYIKETLVTHDIEFTMNNIDSELSKLNFNIYLIKNNNTFTLQIRNFNYIQIIGMLFEKLNSLIINRHGWFPSKMKMLNISGYRNSTIFNEDYLAEHHTFISEVEITYEANFDIATNVPDVLYHLSIQEFSDSIVKRGLIPKSKSKLSVHLDRIYLCDDIEHCKSLIRDMKIAYNYKYYLKKKKSINYKWIIYEIDSSELNIKLYKDPNYINGYYAVDNIPSDLIKIIESE